VQDAVSPGKYVIEVLGPEALQALSESRADRALKKRLDEHFFEHPLLTVDRDLAARETRQRLRGKGLPKRTRPESDELELMLDSADLSTLIDE